MGSQEDQVMLLPQLITMLYQYEGESWYESGVDEVRSLLTNFTVQDWQELSHIWKQQSELWQDRLAYVLGTGNPRYEVPQLMRMIVEGKKEVALTARESFRDFDADRVKAQFNEQCVEEFSLPTKLLEPSTTVNDVIKYLETKSGYEVRGGVWTVKPGGAS
jgi:hypothetical protein